MRLVEGTPNIWGRYLTRGAVPHRVGEVGVGDGDGGCPRVHDVPKDGRVVEHCRDTPRISTGVGCRMGARGANGGVPGIGVSSKCRLPPPGLLWGRFGACLKEESKSQC